MSGILFLNNIDLNNNRINNVLLQNLESDPSPFESKIYYNTSLKKIRFYNGTDWVSLEDSGSLSGVTSIAGTAPIAVNTSTGDITVSISAAGAESAGSMSSTHFSLVNGATNNNTLETLVRRDNSTGGFTAGTITTTQVTGLDAPTNDTDAANKLYVDSARSGLDAKQSVKVATTAPITPSGTLTIDTISLSVGDRVLVKDQEAKEDNGIYVVASSAWSRSADANSNDLVNPGMFTFVEEGSVNANTGWVLSTNNPITIGSTHLDFVKFSSQGEILAGNGLSKSGNTLTVQGTTDRITVSGSGVDIASTYVGQDTITTLGTIATGTWQGTAVGVAYGGTGLTSVTSGSFLTGNGTGALVERNVGQVKSDLSLNNVENTALSTWTGSTNITSLGTIATGTWSGTTIAVDKGGTGAINAADARNNLGATTKFTQSIGNGTDTTFTVTHNLGTRDVQVYVYENGGDYSQVYCQVKHPNTNFVELAFSTAPDSSELRVVVIG